VAQKIVLIIGSVWGRLTVLAQAEPLIYWRRPKGNYALCRCECGKIVTVQFKQLRSGKTQSCGCLRNEKARERRIVPAIGSVFGRLTVIAQAEPLTYRRGGTFGPTYEKHRVVVRCECGTQLIVRVDSMRNGNTRSCGCLHNEQLRRRSVSHGKRHTPEWTIWVTMKQRCENPNDKGYPGYGGRGITVCDRWCDDPANFFEDMGPRPTPQHSIERKITTSAIRPRIVSGPWLNSRIVINDQRSY
jgi:hypothetical protein